MDSFTVLQNMAAYLFSHQVGIPIGLSRMSVRVFGIIRGSSNKNNNTPHGPNKEQREHHQATGIQRTRRAGSPPEVDESEGGPIGLASPSCSSHLTPITWQRQWEGQCTEWPQ
jgi:hypothetical protein